MNNYFLHQSLLQELPLSLQNIDNSYTFKTNADMSRFWSLLTEDGQLTKNALDMLSNPGKYKKYKANKVISQRLSKLYSYAANHSDEALAHLFGNTNCVITTICIYRKLYNTITNLTVGVIFDILKMLYMDVKK